MAESEVVIVGETWETTENSLYEEKKGAVVDKIQKREEELAEKREKRRLEKEKTSAEDETSDFFATTFRKEKSAIEKLLDESDSTPKDGLSDHFDVITAAMQKLQKFVTDSTSFLPSYDVRQAQDTIGNLQAALTEKREQLIPKKKFAFKKKKEGVKEPKKKATKVATEVKPGVQVASVVQIECGFADKDSQTLTLQPREIENQDVSLARLTNCTVKLYGSAGTVHISNVTGCRIFTGPVSRSIFVDDCKDTVLVIACQQLRVHHTLDTSFYLHVTSRGIIEDSTRLLFAPYNWAYPDMGEHYKKAGLDKDRNTWDDIDDFNWLASDAHSPNWAVMNEEDRVSSWEP
ncbi:tubulin-specific chaperone C-like isoform X2 [Branchiostoma floridae]|uniref:Tubulin-specific chaperone C n=1 Tax=Branchiostoma floridae TaxID=7739 RepID=A0A9J7KSD8_BRAFL|nr:tubulin-specific chaperone C-like isoform X1 [Branchiostoma floridae]XP_035669625.1 tubulin-specific chaperone C-like isoform X2 [Branchiostoma floridae]